MDNTPDNARSNYSEFILFDTFYSSLCIHYTHIHVLVGNAKSLVKKTFPTGILRFLE